MTDSTQQHSAPATATGGCPVHHGGESARKTIALPTYDQPIEVDADGVWHLRDYNAVRQVLRSENTRQAGFLAEMVTQQKNALSNPPVLYLEGEAHRDQRRKTAKYFTPSQTSQQYRDLMSSYADTIIDDLQKQGRADLSALSMRMAVKVAGQIIGLTDSVIGGMHRRLNRMLSLDVDSLEWSLTNIAKMLSTQVGTFSFFYFDVKPAIRARRENPQDDVISHLIAEGYSDQEILVECITYGAAGMVTTREFISIVLLHMLENPALRDRMMQGEQEERYAILHELLRLEPVVGNLYRRATADIMLDTDDGPITIPAGALIDLNIYAANADEGIVGEAPDAVCPGREMAAMRPAVPAWVMGFGDGSHRCPGAYVAIQETDIFLRKLLALPNLRVEKAPSISRNALVKGYEVRDFIIAVN
jgi:cytochrome P450